MVSQPLSSGSTSSFWIGVRDSSGRTDITNSKSAELLSFPPSRGFGSQPVWALQTEGYEHHHRKPEFNHSVISLFERFKGSVLAIWQPKCQSLLFPHIIHIIRSSQVNNMRWSDTLPVISCQREKHLDS